MGCRVMLVSAMDTGREVLDVRVHWLSCCLETPPGLVAVTPPMQHRTLALIGSSGVMPSVEFDDIVDGIEGISGGSVTVVAGSPVSPRSPLISLYHSPKSVAAAFRSIQPSPTIRSPSLRSTSWFNEFIRYSESVHSPSPDLRTPLLDTLYRFSLVFDNYEEGHALESFIHSVEIKHDCNNCRTLYAVDQLCKIVKKANRKEDIENMEKWARAIIGKALHTGLWIHNLGNRLTMLGQFLGEVYLGLRKAAQAKTVLDAVIMEMT